MQRALGEVIQRAAPSPTPRINLVPCSKRCILPIYEHRHFFFFLAHSQSGLLLGNHPANTLRSAVLWGQRFLRKEDHSIRAVRGQEPRAGAAQGGLQPAPLTAIGLSHQEPAHRRNTRDTPEHTAALHLNKQ